MIRDRNLDKMRRLHRIPYHAFVHQVIGPTTGGELASIDTNSPNSAEVSTFGYSGLELATTDAMACLELELPTIADPREEIGVRVLWTTNGAVAASDTVTWVVTYDQADVGEALAAPATALDTAITAANPSTTTLLLRRSPRGIISANKFDWTARQGVISFKVVSTLGGFEVDEVVFLGLEFDYMPKFLRNDAEDTNTMNLGVSD